MSRAWTPEVESAVRHIATRGVFPDNSPYPGGSLAALQQTLAEMDRRTAILVAFFKFHGHSLLCSFERVRNGDLWQLVSPCNCGLESSRQLALPGREVESLARVLPDTTAERSTTQI